MQAVSGDYAVTRHPRSTATFPVMGLGDEVLATFRGRGFPVSSFDVQVLAIRRRPGRAAFEVRRRVAGCDRSRSFMTRALADSYRAELIRATRKGAGFDPATGEPAAWAAPEPTTVTWYQHAVAYAQMKWPAPGAAFAGQPGRRAGYDHSAADDRGNPGPHPAPSPARSRDYARRVAIARHTRRRAQRIGLRPDLVCRPPGRPRPRTGRYHARPPL